MKTIVWINDKKSDMENIVRGAFPILWEHQVIGKTVFLGDAAFQDMEQFDVDFFKELIKDVLAMKIKSHFTSCASNSEQIKNSLTQMLNYYESDNDDYVYVLAKSKKYLASVISEWNNVVSEYNKNNASIKKIDQCVGKLFASKDNQAEITVPQNEKYLYMLDVVLLKDEDKNLIDGKTKLVLSMALYYYITKKLNAKCFLYSTHTYNSTLQTNWKELYANLDNKADDIVIIPNTQFFPGSTNKNTLESIIKDIPDHKE